jgi:hypothetical protein
MSTTIERTVTISEETYQSLRNFVSEEGDGFGEDMSLIIEKAVAKYIFERVVAQMRAELSDLTSEEVTQLVDEAVDWARKR